MRTSVSWCDLFWISSSFMSNPPWFRNLQLDFLTSSWLQGNLPRIGVPVDTDSTLVLSWTCPLLLLVCNYRPLEFHQTLPLPPMRVKICKPPTSVSLCADHRIVTCFSSDPIPSERLCLYVSCVNCVAKIWSWNKNGNRLISQAGSTEDTEVCQTWEIRSNVEWIHWIGEYG